jgi:hypothetical protein
MYLKYRQKIFAPGLILFALIGLGEVVIRADSQDLISTHYYEKMLDEILKAWPPRLPEAIVPNQSLLAKAWESSGDSDYIGLQKTMRISASIDVVDRILSDFDHYLNLFPEFKDIHVMSRENGQVLTFWERPVGFIFVPNITYQMVYSMDRSQLDRKVFRVKMKQSNRVLVADDLIVLEKQGSELTQFTAFSFFKADWGPVRILGQGKVWKDSIEGSCLSDLSIKLTAEHPDWSPEKIQNERRHVLPPNFLDTVYDHRQPFVISQVVGDLKSLSAHAQVDPVKPVTTPALAPSTRVPAESSLRSDRHAPHP